MNPATLLLGMLAAASLAADAAAAQAALGGSSAATALLASLLGAQVGLVAWWAGGGGAARWIVASAASCLGATVAAPDPAVRDEWTLAFAAATWTIIALVRALARTAAVDERSGAAAPVRSSSILAWAGAVSLAGWLLASVDAGRVAWSEVAVVAFAVLATTLAAAAAALGPRRTTVAALSAIALPGLAIVACAAAGRTTAETLAACSWLAAGLTLLVVRVSREAARATTQVDEQTRPAVAATAH